MQHHKPYMFNAVYVISRARLQVARNSLWRGKIGRKLGTVALLAVLGLVAWGIYQITGGIVRFLRSPEFIAALQELAAEVPGFETDFQPYLAAVPSLVFFGLLLVLVMSSFSTVLSALYLSGDIDMLLIAPVPMRAVFTVKFLGALLPQYILLAVVLLPFLLGYGVGMGYGARYALVALLLLLLTPLFPGGLGALLVMAAVRVLPARRAREIVGVLGGLIGVAFYLVTQLAGRIVPQFVNAQSVSAILSLNSPLLPSAWAGRALVAAGEGDLATLLLLGSAFTLLSLLSFGGCLLLAERLYYVGWANLANQGGRVRRDGRRQEPEVRSTDERPRNSALYAGLLCFLPVPSRAILVKDLRLFRRDLRNLQQLIFPLAIAAFWMFQLLMGGANASANASSWERTISDLASAGIVFYVCVTLSSTMAGAGISREGKAMYLMKTAPVREREVLLGKVALAYLPYPFVGTLLLAALGLFAGVGIGSLANQWLLLMLSGIGASCISIGLGAWFPNLSWENPQQQTSWQAGCFGVVLLPLYLALVCGLALGGSLLAQTFDSPFSIALTLGGWVLAIIVTVVTVLGGIAVGEHGVERIEL